MLFLFYSIDFYIGVQGDSNNSRMESDIIYVHNATNGEVVAHLSISHIVRKLLNCMFAKKNAQH